VLLIPGNSEILEGAAVKELVRLEGEADGSVVATLGYDRCTRRTPAMAEITSHGRNGQK
jgi:hypothetical protein